MQNYLQKHFLPSSKLTLMLDIDKGNLKELASNNFIPSWSYKIENGFCYSYIFGESKVSNCTNEEYYSPSVIDWFNTNKKRYKKPTSKQIHEDFIKNYILTVKENKLFYEIFDKYTPINSSTLNERAENTWLHHTKGTYGLCVKKPSSILSIIEKTIAVYELTLFTNNGKKYNYTKSELIKLHNLIDNYNKIAMPFSTVDYKGSSRERLVDNVLKNIN